MTMIVVSKNESFMESSSTLDWSTTIIWRYPMLINSLGYTAPNLVIDVPGSEEFYISYNFKDIERYGCTTTALVWGQMEIFYILNGDHRAAYKKLINQGWDACFRYFQQNIHLVNKHSD